VHPREKLEVVPECFVSFRIAFSEGFQGVLERKGEGVGQVVKAIERDLV
jgi:hypothetical protein